MTCFEEGDPLEPPDITDHDTRLPRLLSTWCDTCIFRPGNLMHLSPGGLASLVGDTIRADSFIVCHSTLRGMAPEGVTPAVCRGFYDRYSTNPLRIYDRLHAWHEVPPPEKG